MNTPVYVINLDRRFDRWMRVRDVLQSAGFNNIRRISAIDGQHLSDHQIKQILTSEAYESIGKVRTSHEQLGSVGAIGCYLSHYKVWGEILASKTPGFVVEDDLILQQNIYKYIMKQQNIKDLDMILFGYLVLRDRAYKNNQNIIPYGGRFFGTQFYYITPLGAAKLLTSALPMKYQVDSYISLENRAGNIRLAYHSPNLGWQRANDSDIQTPMVQRRRHSSAFSAVCLLFIVLGILFGIYFFMTRRRVVVAVSEKH